MVEAAGTTAADGVTALVEDLACLAGRVADDASRVDVIGELERAKAVLSAVQAEVTAALDASQREEQAGAGVPAARRGQGVAAQVALARRESAARGAQHLGLAKALVGEMPHTLAAMRAGRVSEWRATLIVQATAVLSRQDRAAVDAELAGTPEALEVLEQLGDRGVAAAAKTAAYRLDPHSVVARAGKAEGDRRVTVRPAPDTMAYVTALVPVGQAVAVQARLEGDAAAAKAGGDERSRGQLMADALVAAITGYAAPAAGSDDDDTDDADDARAAGGDAHDTAHVVAEQPAPVRGRRPRRPSVLVKLVVTDAALFGGDADDLDTLHEPAVVEGYGPVPAGWARDLVRRALADPDPDVGVWLQRLFTSPTSGQLVAMDSRARCAPPGLAAFVATRDAGTCRTPWCDAPVRHVDHVRSRADGGPTTATNLQGLCEACNHAKQAPGWTATAPSDEDVNDHEVTTTTPTGHSYRSRAPSQPGGQPVPDPATSPLEDLTERWLHAA